MAKKKAARKTAAKKPPKKTVAARKAPAKKAPKPKPKKVVSQKNPISAVRHGKGVVPKTTTSQGTDVGNASNPTSNDRDLSGASFGNQKLRGRDFRGANLQGSNFGGADCRSTDFREANLSKAWMSGGKYLQADFSGARLWGAAIRDADCRGAIFYGSDLGGVDFSFADLRNVDLSGAKLEGAELFRVKIDEQTVFPPTFVINPELRIEWRGAKKRSPGYRSRCSLDELVALIPPPPQPSHAQGDWEASEEQMGVRFPSDFKQLIGKYGAGEFLSDIRIYNPLIESGRKGIEEELKIMAELRDASEYLWAIHPEESGMLPWGHDVNGNVYCWLCQGEPDVWPTGILGHGCDEPESDNVNITTFLHNFARNHYPEMQGGQTFNEADRIFVPA